MLTPEAQAAVDKKAGEDKARWDGDLPLFDPTVGLNEPVVGGEVWARDSGPNMRLRHDGQPRGGIIIKMWDVETVTDEGEFVWKKAFLLWDYDPTTSHNRRKSILYGDQLDAYAVGLPNRRRLWALYRRWCAWISERRGAPTAEELERCEWIHILSKIVGESK